MSKSVKNIAIMASGAGSNAQKIIEYFSNRKDIRVQLIISNKRDAGVLSIASKAGISSLVISKDSFYYSNSF